MLVGRKKSRELDIVVSGNETHDYLMSIMVR